MGESATTIARLPFETPSGDPEQDEWSCQAWALWDDKERLA